MAPASKAFLMQLGNPELHRQFPFLAGAGNVFHEHLGTQTEFLGFANIFHIEPAHLFCFGPLWIMLEGFAHKQAPISE